MQFRFNSTQAQNVELNQCNFNENMQNMQYFLKYFLEHIFKTINAVFGGVPPV